MQCKLGVGSVAAHLLKHYVMMKGAGIVYIQQTLFSGKSLSVANSTFWSKPFCESVPLFPNIFLISSQWQALNTGSDFFSLKLSFDSFWQHHLSHEK